MLTDEFSGIMDYSWEDYLESYDYIRWLLWNSIIIPWERESIILLNLLTKYYFGFIKIYKSFKSKNTSVLDGIDIFIKIYWSFFGIIVNTRLKDDD